MRVDAVTYTSFRNYERFLLDCNENVVIIIGPNAVGKTNLIEGIQLTTALTSFRNPHVNHLIQEGKSEGYVSTKVSDNDRSLVIELALTQEGRSYTLNKKKKRTRDIRGILPAVLFCPDDLTLIKGAQSMKRVTLDALGSQLSANYHAIRKDYDKILRQKNHYLKGNVSHSYLQSINEVIASIGAHLYYLRSSLLDELTPYVQRFYSELTHNSEVVDIRYIPSWKRKDGNFERVVEIPRVSRENARQALTSAMEEYYLQEHERHCSLFGPQVDRVEFYLNGRNASMFASQGQQRSLVLSYKMAEVALITDKIGYHPVLLLDDVMSELDIARREQLMSLLSGAVQTFITATNKEYFSPAFLHSSQVVEIERGTV